MLISDWLMQGSRLGQAEAQLDYNKMTSDVKTKLQDIENIIDSSETGDDIRGEVKII